jgi:hypothetical protein
VRTFMVHLIGTLLIFWWTRVVSHNLIWTMCSASGPHASNTPAISPTKYHCIFILQGWSLSRDFGTQSLIKLWLVHNLLFLFKPTSFSISGNFGDHNLSCYSHAIPKFYQIKLKGEFF